MALRPGHDRQSSFDADRGEPLTTANVRCQLRKVLGEAGTEGVTPHMFRRTVATVINEQASLNLAAELLGHTIRRSSSSTTSAATST